MDSYFQVDAYVALSEYKNPQKNLKPTPFLITNQPIFGVPKSEETAIAPGTGQTSVENNCCDRAITRWCTPKYVLSLPILRPGMAGPQSCTRIIVRDLVLSPPHNGGHPKYFASENGHLRMVQGYSGHPYLFISGYTSKDWQISVESVPRPTLGVWSISCESIGFRTLDELND